MTILSNYMKMKETASLKGMEIELEKGKAKKKKIDIDCINGHFLILSVREPRKQRHPSKKGVLVLMPFSS